MKVLVVGGAGYIGSHAVKALLRGGAEVTVFDNLSSGLRGNLRPGAAFRHGDILDARALDEACGERKYDGVIHLAALKAAGESMTLPEKYSVHNITGTLNLLNAVSRHGIGHFVFSSSAAVYGDPEYLPMDEKHPTRPANYYGYTKLAIEGFLEWYGRLKGLRYAALRYFNAAGYDVDGELAGLEQNPNNLVPVIMEAAMGWRRKVQIFGDDYDTRDGTCIRDYIHVTDLARAHAMALDKLMGGTDKLLVNLGTGEGITVMEMVKKASEISGIPVPHEIVGRREGDPPSVVASAGLARALLGWEARHSDVGTLLGTTWKAYQANAKERRT
ncbi:MAG TPA: UDP-glucose 4-epimerase GalE [Fibrobacteria bacterium]|nr:UDP-glucose 4-epimerase GalE [Fibrobacteria bacterium]